MPLLINIIHIGFYIALGNKFIFIFNPHFPISVLVNEIDCLEFGIEYTDCFLV